MKTYKKCPSALVAIFCALVFFTLPMIAGEPAFNAQGESLREAVSATPYAALLIHTKVEIIPVLAKTPNRKAIPKADQTEEERHVYHARVLETFKGKAQPTIRYEMIVERGEQALIVNKPQIVTLCKGPRGYYWPGTGASFASSVDLIAIAKSAARQPTNAKLSNAQCE